MKKIIPYLIMTVLTVILTKDLLFVSGFPSTHDGQNHMARFANYYLAIKQGQFPPRFAPNLEAGLGYPVFNFHYPLANILAVPLIVIGLDLQTTTKILFIGSLWVAGIGMYLYLSTRYSRHAAVIGAAAYIIAPYQLTNLFARGNIGETMSLCLLPWVLWLSVKSLQQSRFMPWFTVSLALLWLSHNLLAFVFTPLIILILAMTVKPNRLVKLAAPAGIALLLVMFFWLPALAEKHFTVLDRAHLNSQQLSGHLLRPSQLLSGPWEHGYSYSFPVDGMNYSVGLLTLTALFITPMVLMLSKSTKSWPWFETTIFGITLFTAYAMTQPALWFWQAIPPLSILQFSWRLLAVIAVTGALLTAYVFTRLSFAVGAALIIISAASTMQSQLGIGYFKYANDYWFSYPLNTTIQNENDTIWQHRTNAMMLMDKSTGPVISEKDAQISIGHWTGSRRSYTVETNENQVITEKTLYFPGWQTTVDGQPVDLFATADRQAGLINFDVPSGTHSVETRFTQNTPARLAGNTLSILGMIGLVYSWRRTRDQNSMA